jgi:hypothetical protein
MLPCDGATIFCYILFTDLHRALSRTWHGVCGVCANIAFKARAAVFSAFICFLSQLMSLASALLLCSKLYSSSPHPLSRN